MEIIVLPYMGISFAIAWAIFAPFAELDDLRQWSFARIEIADLLAVFLPISILMAVAIWTESPRFFSIPLLVALTVAILLIAGCGFVIGLYLVSKMNDPPAAKRMAIIGIIVPLGSLLTLAWIAVPLWAAAYSILYSIPAAAAVVPIALALRGLSAWACQVTPRSESFRGVASDSRLPRTLTANDE